MIAKVSSIHPISMGAWPKKRKVQKFKVWEDQEEGPYPPGPSQPDLTTDLQQAHLKAIQEQSTNLLRHHTEKEVYRLLIISDFADFFRKRVQVSQQEIDMYCGYSKTSFKRARNGDSLILTQLQQGFIKRDPRGHQKKLTKAQVDSIDDTLEHEG